MAVVATIATLAFVAPAPAEAAAVSPREACKIDAAYNVLLGRQPDRGGYEYWRAHVEAGLTNGNGIIEHHVPASHEYRFGRRGNGGLIENTSASHLNLDSFVRRLIQWNYGRQDPGLHGWFVYLAQTYNMEAPQLLAWEVTFGSGRCATAERLGRYTVRLR